MNFPTIVQLAAILVVTFAHTVTAGPAVPRNAEDVHFGEGGTSQ
jgi:hypothetical protein